MVAFKSTMKEYQQEMIKNFLFWTRAKCYNKNKFMFSKSAQTFWLFKAIIEAGSQDTTGTRQEKRTLVGPVTFIVAV